MVSKKISELPAAASLTATMQFEVNDAGTSKRVSGSVVAGYALDRAINIEKVALADADTPGGILAWANPAGVPILVPFSYLLISAAGANPGFVNVIDGGVAPDATTSSMSLMEDVALPDGIPGFRVIRILANDDNYGAPAVLAAGEWLTVSRRTGTAAGLAGFAYIYWHKAT